MGLESIHEYLENKTILVTGATGLLGMVFVEKILRVQPNMKKLYLLIRASDDKSATHRMHNEIVRNELFDVLREKRGADFDSFISEKLVALPGDITDAGLRVKEIKLREKLCNEIQIILNSAATVNFDDRYDTSLEINIFGALNVLSFAKECSKLEILVHVTTAYVCGEQSGLIQENFSSMDALVKKSTNSDLMLEEKTTADDTLKELKAQNASETDITNRMKELGAKRAKLYGWPNTYVFTKAMAEIYLHRLKDSVPLVIIRPTAVTSTYKEPFPGWIQGLRTVDSMIAALWKGHLPCLPMGSTAVVDLIPVDMLVNSIITSIVDYNINKSSQIIIYNVGTSRKNPLKFSTLYEIAFRYCTTNPLLRKDKSPIKIDRLKFLKSMDAFRSHMQIRYMVPLEAVKLLNKEFDQHFKDVYVNYNRKITLTTRLAELYEPYLLFEGIFDDTNSEELRRMAREKYTDAKSFDFDPTCINWEDYLLNSHLPGLWKHVMSKKSHSRL